jgi:adenylate cyclase
VSQAVYDRAGRDLVGGEGREYHLKGFDAPVQLYAA